MAGALGVAFAVPDREGGFRAAEVEVSAKWFVHVDLVSLRGSEIGKEMMSYIDGDAERKIQAFKRMISFNPLEDLDAVTLFGGGAEPEKAVAVLRGVFNVEHLTDLVIAADGYESGTHRGKTVHSWDDDNTPSGRLFGCLLSERTMLMGPDRELVHTGIDLMAGEGDSIVGGETFAIAGEEKRRPIVAAAVDLEGLGDLEIESAFLRKVSSVYLAAGEDDGEVFARLIVGAEDERVPVLLGKMLSGVLAFGEAAEQLPVGAESAFIVETKGEQLTVQAGMALAPFMKMVRGLDDLKGRF